ncbi:MAG: hypothetical protein WKH68_02790, partial [Candidatus Limnocylindria bacterium]
MTFSLAQDAFFTDYFHHYPVHATNAGNHEHDGAWPDMTDAGTQKRLSWLAGARASLGAAHGLTRHEEIDRRVLVTQIDELRFDEEDLDEASWSPIVYNYLLGGGLFALVSREFAPLAEPRAPAAPRLEGLPAHRA